MLGTVGIKTYWKEPMELHVETACLLQALEVLASSSGSSLFLPSFQDTNHDGLISQDEFVPWRSGQSALKCLIYGAIRNFIHCDHLVVEPFKPAFGGFCIEIVNACACNISALFPQLFHVFFLRYP